MAGHDLTSACPWPAWIVALPLLVACAMIVLRRWATALGLLSWPAMVGLIAAWDPA